MCGIAGIVSATELAAEDRHRVIAMRDVLTHRGPDEAGLFADGQAALGHRRLSIVDLATGSQPLSNEDGSIWIAFNGEIYNHRDLRRELEDHDNVYRTRSDTESIVDLATGSQPLSNEDGSIWIAFNGEIYNHRDLRRELEDHDHVYRTRSDTESIVHAYEQWGDACVDRLRGMFAFVIWDARRRRLLAARDRLGVKPLYWAQVDDRLIFASEIKGLLESGLITARANDAAIPELLGTRSLAGSETMFHGIQKLLPGHTLTFERGDVQCRRYWDIPAPGQGASAQSRSRAEDVERFRALLDESIALRLMSDVPLGVFLSGGIDSSAIAALMAKRLTQPLQTFSVAFADRAYSELEYARQVSRAIGGKGHEIVIDDRDFFGALPRLVWHEDEPIAHPSSVPLYFVSKLARQTVTVVLTGEGSDELLAGYGKYPRSLFNWRAGSVYTRAVPRALRDTLAANSDRVPGVFGRYMRRSFVGVEHAPDLTFFDTFAGVNLTEQRRLLSPRLALLASAERAYGSSMAYFNARGDRTGLLDRVLYADLKTYLVELLMKQDQMSMAASIESRVPFLDHHLVEFAAGLPANRKLSGWSTKRILREAVRDVLPQSILERPKMGFPVPFGRWVQNGWGPVVREVLLDRRSRQRGILEPAAVERLLTPGTPFDQQRADAVWALLNLELWYRTFIDRGGIQTLPTPQASIASNDGDPAVELVAS